MSTLETVDVKHLLCIAYGIHNPGYENDSAFSSSYEYVKNMSGGSRLGTELNRAFILGLYPELKEPIEEFRKRAQIIDMKKLDNQSCAKELNNAGDLVIGKYNLPQVVKKSSPEEIKRNLNVQKAMKEAVLNEIQKNAGPVIAGLASKYANKINDFNELNTAVVGFRFASWILTGKIDEKEALPFIGKMDGVELGINLLQLKKEGIITENEVMNINKFNQSKAVKNFTINGKSFDLSPDLSKQQINESKKNR